jgi:hypothetical protein
MTSTIKVDNIQDQDGNNIINENANTITIGASGDTVTLASGASQSGFGRSGTVDWDTTPKTASFTAVSGTGYFVNTTSSAITMTMPSGSAGAIVSIQDYNKTFDTNALTVSPASGEKINGGDADGILIIETEGQGLTFVYVDSTVGWKTVHENDFTAGGSNFIIASGGTETTCGDYKIHTFTGPGTFTVTNAGAGTPCAPSIADYLVVAGGGAGASTFRGGGGGAGGVRFSATTYCEPSPATPLKAPAGLTLSATSYPITVGAGAAKTHFSSCPVTTPTNNPNGANSTFSTITSAGGGAGGEYPASREGVAGGSGGGSNGNPDGPSTTPRAGASGNTPPVSPPQGKDGGDGGAAGAGSGNARSGGGGGGMLAAGGDVATDGDGGPGGNGITLNISGSCSSYGGGGGGGSYTTPYPTAPAPGGTGGGGQGAGRNASYYVNNSTSGTTNTGGGGGGNSAPGAVLSDGTIPGQSNVSPGNGGSGIVIIRYKYQ